MTEEEVTFPLFYAKGDRPWIAAQLMFLNFDMRKKICSEYEDIYLKNRVEGRRMANEWLKAQVDEHGSPESRLVKNFKGNIPEGMKKRIESLRKTRNRKTILGMAGES